MRLWGEGAYEREPVDGAGTKYIQLFRAQAGDLIVNKIWARNGSVGVVTEQLAGCFGSNEFPMFAPNRSLVEPGWLHLLTKTPNFWTQCDEKSRGTSGQNRIHAERFVEIEIPLPPTSEQRRIVARIEGLADRIGRATRLRQQAAKDATVLPASYTSQLFDELDSCPKVRIRGLGIDGQTPVQTGPFGAQLHASDFVDVGVPVLNVGNVWPEGLRLDQLDHVLPEKAQQLGRYSVNVGDLLFARSGATLGKVCLVPDQCSGWLMTGHLFRVRFDPSCVVNRFAFAALRHARSIHEQVFGQVRGATRPGYNTTLLGNVELPLPSLSKQHDIVVRLEAFQRQVDELRRSQNETTAELNALMPAILDRAFKGEL